MKSFCCRFLALLLAAGLCMSAAGAVSAAPPVLEPTSALIPEEPTASENMPLQQPGTFIGCWSSELTDVSSTTWYHDAVDYVGSHGLMTGTGETVFEPETRLTRAMMATVLYRIEGCPAVKGSATFTDVPDGRWYSVAVAWAEQSGLILGYGDGRFGPEDTITREQLAVLFYRYAGTENTVARADISDFTDAGSVASWAVDAVQWAVERGLLRGTSPDRLEPQGFTTRAQVAAIFQRYLTAPVRHDETLTLRYEPNGGTGEAMEPTATLCGGNAVLRRNTYNARGYSFRGWYARRDEDDTYYGYDADGRLGWYSGDTIALFETLADGSRVPRCTTGGTVTLYAVWTPITFTVRFHGNGGIGSMEDQKISYSIATHLRPNTFECSGYVFDGWTLRRASDGAWHYAEAGWYQEGEQPEGSEKTVYADMKSVAKLSAADGDVIDLYAAWREADCFTVTYDAGGGTGTMADTTVAYGEPTTLRANTFTRDGWLFAGWNVYNAAKNQWIYTDGSGNRWCEAGKQPEGYTLKIYPNGSKVAKIGKPGDTVCLTASWVPDGTLDLPVCGGVPAKNTYNCGQGFSDPNRPAEQDSLMRLYSETSPEDFNDYLSKLEANGYHVEYTNRIDSNLYAGCRKGDTRLYVYYTAAAGEIRVILDKTSTCSPDEFGYEKTGDGFTAVYQYGLSNSDNLEENSDGQVGNGMLYFCKLADNSIFVIDGGSYRQFDDAACEELLDFLRQITGSTGKIRIACWYITHLHADHCSGFMKLLQAHPDLFELERVACNPVSRNGDAFLGAASDATFERLSRELQQIFGTDFAFLKLHAGQEFDLCGVRAQVLTTHEDMVSAATGKSLISTDYGEWNDGQCYITNDFNNTGTVVKLTFDGKSFLVTGDINRPAMRQLMRNFSDDTLRADIVQIAHHAINNLPELYMKTKAAIVFYPCAEFGASRYAYRVQYRTLTGLFADGVYFQDNLTTGVQVVAGKLTVVMQKKTVPVIYDGVWGW